MQRARAGRELASNVAAQPRRAYLAEPASGPGRGVLVVHEADGLGEFARDLCDRLAREGFVALAPDWLAGDAEQVLDAGVDQLLGRDACDGPRVGALGCGQGGPLALELALRNRRIGAVVSLWGAPRERTPDVARLEAACLALFAERDELAPPAAARALEAQLRASGRRGAVKVVPEVGAGFLDAGRPAAFAAAAASAAWADVLAFLRAELA